MLTNYVKLRAREGADMKRKWENVGKNDAEHRSIALVSAASRRGADL